MQQTSLKMTENKDKDKSANTTTCHDKDRDRKNDMESTTTITEADTIEIHEKDKEQQQQLQQQEQNSPVQQQQLQAATTTHESRIKGLAGLLDILPYPSIKSATSRSTSPQPQHQIQQQQQQQQQQQKQKQKQQHQQYLGATLGEELRATGGHNGSGGNGGNTAANSAVAALGGNAGGNNFYHTTQASYHSEIVLLDMDTGEISDFAERLIQKDEFGTQRVYKKTSPNCVLTLYLPTREITLAGNTPAILRGIVFVDPKAIQGYRVYAQLTLTFRYGREDEEVMGLRFCNEAIMSLHQIWPRSEEPSRDSLSPLQEALIKRLGDGAHPFTLTLTPQAPPSVQLVPAKRYYGAPIGTSYDVRCFIADKTDEKFHRRASVKMGVRVIYRADVFHHPNGPENFAALINNQTTSSPPMTAALTSPPASTRTTTTTIQEQQDLTQKTTNINENCSSTDPVHNATTTTATKYTSSHIRGSSANGSGSSAMGSMSPGSGGGGICNDANTRIAATHAKPRKSERGESFPKLRLSPKSFRFSNRFGRSKSEIEKCPNDPFYSYSKSFQEYDCISGAGPQGAVDKPFLLQDGRVGLRASLDKAWYTHGEDVCVTVNIRNDSRKTVRKVRVCAIQHVDVCMFNNGKFKNVVADSDNQSPPVDRTVPPGGTLNATITLKPQRGPTKNWIALEDTLQRSTEPDEITGAIAASAVRGGNPHSAGSNVSPSPAIGIPQVAHYHGNTVPGDDRNVFAIYVSYYVKVKLTLSGMGGELSLKLPFVLVHVNDEGQRNVDEVTMEKLALDDVPAGKRNGNKNKDTKTESEVGKSSLGALDRIESVDDVTNITLPVPTNGTNNIAADESANNKRRLLRSETLAKDLDEEIVDEHMQTLADVERPPASDFTTAEVEDTNVGTDSFEMEHVHVVQIHTQAQIERLAEREEKDVVATPAAPAIVNELQSKHKNATEEISTKIVEETIPQVEVQEIEAAKTTAEATATTKTEAPDTAAATCRQSTHGGETV